MTHLTLLKLAHVCLTVHARAIFVEKYPRGSVFDVIHGITHEIEETESFAGGAYYNILLVVYKDPGTTEKYKLVISVLDRQNVAEGLEHLLKELRRRVGFEIRKSHSLHI